MTVFTPDNPQAFKNAAANAEVGPLLRGAEPREKWLIALIIAVAAAWFFFVGLLRYAAFRTGGMDVGFFDQACYLISQGQVPYSTYLNIHILVDHASYALYLVGGLYWIYPTVQWLFLIQAASWAGAAWPLWRLARQQGVSAPMTRAVVVAYLLYPVVTMATMRDFAPEVMVVPALLAMVLCARQGRWFWFIFWMLLALSTKEFMALTVAATGFWLAVFDKRRAYGIVTMAVAIPWYFIATQIVVPHCAGDNFHDNMFRFFDYMGASQSEFLHTLVFRPWVPLIHILSVQTAFYVVVMGAPVIWGLSWRRLGPLVAAMPCVVVNLLSNDAAFRGPFEHYSWPVVPFVFLAVIATLGAGEGWFKSGRPIVGWTVALVLIGLVARAHQLDFAQSAAGATGTERRKVLAMIDDGGGVLTTHQTAAHLSHRKVIQFIFYAPKNPALRFPPADQIDWMFIDFHEDSIINIQPHGTELLEKYRADPHFRLIYHNGDLYLFHRIAPGV